MPSKVFVVQPLAEDRRKVLGENPDDPCCGKKCFVVTVVGLFLFVTFVSLPAGVFLIIHGNRKSLVGFKVGGALVVSIPIVIAFAFCLILCFRRKWTRRLTLQPSTRSPTLV
ncbi:uncharacterized protein LOC143299454 isoform X2 [Babylonia areolata]|uniref:uncharacterized protein LOC143299454 isoform X2 n=1 Tax=Babylonia areolata TaxID=304850 RepID=UPI003FCF8837